MEINSRNCGNFYEEMKRSFPLVIKETKWSSLERNSAHDCNLSLQSQGFFLHSSWT